MTDPRAFDDQKIVKATKLRPRDGGTAQLVFVLPSGREITSAEGPPAELKKRIIAWCEFVRSNIASDARPATQPATPSAAPQAALTQPSTPIEALTLQVQLATESERMAKQQLDNAQLAHQKAFAVLLAWQKALQAITS